MDYYPENSLSNFRVKLPITLNLLDIEKWFVGITRFSCTSIKNLPHKPSNIFNVNKNTIFFKTSSNLQKLNIINVLFVVPCFLNDVDEIFLNEYLTKEIDINVNIYKESNIIKFTTHNNKTIEIPILNVFTQQTLFDYYFNKIPYDDRKMEINFLNETLKSRKINYNVKNYESFVEIFNQINYVCIYSDIIKPRIVGDRISRIMYMQPMQNENYWLDRNVKTIKNIEYCPLESSIISEINILIADETGEQIHFNDDTFSTMISLHFIKVI